MGNESGLKRTERSAAVALLVGTLFWGCGFTWAKAAGEAVQDAAGLSHDAPFGPVFLLAWRFLFASAIWFVIFPASRRGWSWRALGWGILVGVLCGAGLIVQHVGLARTSEAVSAFLTSLTILFVPVLMTVVFHKPPRGVLWGGVVLATGGVWLMTGAQPQGFGWGGVLGLLCALFFSLYILAVNAAVEREDPFRMTAAQFVMVSVLCFATCPFLDRGGFSLHAVSVVQVLSLREVWVNLGLLTLFTTLIAFGLLTFYQPRIDPTRAALIYLAEPVFATVYAALAAGHRTGPLTLAGAALILIANLLVEILSARKAETQEERVVLVD